MYRGRREKRHSYAGHSQPWNQHTGNMPTAAGNSSSWSSPRTLEGARLVRLQGMANHLGLSRSPYFPKNIGQYSTHLHDFHNDRFRAETERMKERIACMKTLDEWGKPFKYAQFLNGKVLEFKRIDAKGAKRERVWPYGTTRQGEEPERNIGWPSAVEAKFDGEYRAKKGLKRQLPVPKRKVDEETAVRLMNMGMMVETAMELLYAPDDEVDAMLKAALDEYGMDELAWKHIEADLIKAEKEEQEKWHKARQEAEYKKHGSWHVEEAAAAGGQWFDEGELRKHGKWTELLNELNWK